MNLLQALVLGAVQGATEFIPVSSTGHLILIPWLFHWKDPGLAFDLATHIGTLVALLWVFGRDWIVLGGSMVRWLINLGRCDTETTRRAAVALWILLACLPAAVAGYLLGDVVETALRTPYVIAATMGIVAFVMLAADRLGAKRRKWGEASLRDWMLVGLAQALALVPGVSRSGITISQALALGFEREAAARCSFLLSAPVIAGAAAVHLKDLPVAVKQGALDMQVIVAASVSAAVVGYLCIKFLLRFLQSRGLTVFVWYRVAASLAILALAQWGGLH